MSLLLDALKKAAEQNAENSKETGAERQSSDETLLLDQTSTERADETQTGLVDRTSTELLEETFTELIEQTRTEVAEETFTELIDQTETKIEQQSDDESEVITDEDVTAFMGDDTLLRNEQTSVTKSSPNDSESETSYTESIEPDELANEDTAVSRFDQDNTFTALDATRQTNASLDETDLEQTPFAEITKSLNLVEVPDNDASEVKISKADITRESTSLSELKYSSLSGEGTSTRMDSTSTATYAPDNYDRTLRKPADDASRFFAGLKSDTDIVMTPEYAKTMFRSKLSAKRLQSFKIYSATAVIILLVIAIFGVLEIDQETINIDNSLRSLKRDPMPGLIKNATGDAFTNVFAAEPGSEVDATTLLLVENAELMVDTEEVVTVELGINVDSPSENENLQNTHSDTIVADEVQAITVAKIDSNAANNISLSGVGENGGAASTTIQIITKNEVSEKDRWLNEAYAAYQRGDDPLALAKYNAVLEVDPGNRNALLARAAIKIQNNQVAEAIRDYQVLLLSNPKDSLAMSSMIAVANYSPAQSETQLKLMIRDEPNSPYLNFALGNIFGAQNRWQEAQGMYFTAFENNPDDPNYAYNLAVSLEHIAKPNVAIAYYERALSNFSKGLATFDRAVVDARLELLKQL